MELEHHQTTGTSQMNLLLPVQHPDVFSFYSVSWKIAEREADSLAEELIAATCINHWC